MVNKTNGILKEIWSASGVLIIFLWLHDVAWWIPHLINSTKPLEATLQLFPSLAALAVQNALLLPFLVLGVSLNHVTCPWTVTFSLPLELQELKVMMLGSAAACFSEEWRCQSFTFSSRPALRYGIVQKKVTHICQCIYSNLSSHGVMWCVWDWWKLQSDVFVFEPELSNSAVLWWREQGGPCGVLAAVQAAVLHKLLFEGSGRDALSE